MKVAFFNQPWLVSRYPAGTRLVLHGKFEARNRFGVQSHAVTAGAGTGGDAGGALPGHRGIDLDGDPGARPPAREALATSWSRCPPRCGFASSCPTEPRRWRFALPGDPRTRRTRAAGWRFEELLLVQLALLRRRRMRRRAQTAVALGGEPELSARWLETMLPFELTGTSAGRSRRSTAIWRRRSRCSGC